MRKEPFPIKNILDSLREDVQNGTITLSQAAEELHRAGWSNYIDEDTARLTKLRDKLIAGLSKIPHSALNGDPVHRLPTNVNFCFEGIEGESLLLLLDQAGICASSSSLTRITICFGLVLFIAPPPDKYRVPPGTYLRR